MVLFESLALLGGLKDIFLYNRDLFMFNRGINQQRVYHTQKMRIEQIMLYRDDLRDLFDLTIGKMENYLVVNTLTLAFCMGFFYEGRMPDGTPTWLFWLWGMSLSTAVLFMMMSVWFAIYALITAQTFSVRLLTQWLRLPVPTQEAIVHATGTAEDFEKLPKSSLLRVPILSESGKTDGQSSSSATPPPTSAEHDQEIYPPMANPALEFLFSTNYRHFVDHFYLFRYLQENWAGYDAYARVCMVVGTTQLLSTIAYMGAAWYVSGDNRWGGIVFTVLMIVFATIHARMNVLLSRKELVALSFLLVAGPVLGCTGAILDDFAGEIYETIVAWLTPASYLCHLGSITFFIAMGSEKDGNLPTKYATVISIDVLGLWDKGKVIHDEDYERKDDPEWKGGVYVEAVTGWKKRWLKATKREAPITQLIPPSQDAVNADRERRLRPERLEELVYRKKITTSHGIRQKPGDGGGLHMGDHEVTPEMNVESTESEVVETPDLMPTKRITTLPWTSFRQAGALVILVWIAALGGAVWEAITLSVPGWQSR
jgi:hypothetical protein